MNMAGVVCAEGRDQKATHDFSAQSTSRQAGNDAL